jgi:hypothetical protein
MYIKTQGPYLTIAAVLTKLMLATFKHVKVIAGHCSLSFNASEIVRSKL